MVHHPYDKKLFFDVMRLKDFGCYLIICGTIMLFFRNLIKYLNELRKLNGYIPSLRVIEIIKDEENFKVKIQMINSFLD